MGKMSDDEDGVRTPLLDAERDNVPLISSREETSAAADVSSGGGYTRTLIVAVMITVIGGSFHVCVP